MLKVGHLKFSGKKRCRCTQVTSHILATSQERFGVEVIGPTLGNVRWQANTDQGIDASQFLIDWEHKHAACPQGRTSSSWTPTFDSRNNEMAMSPHHNGVIYTLSNRSLGNIGSSLAKTYDHKLYTTQYRINDTSFALWSKGIRDIIFW